MCASILCGLILVTTLLSRGHWNVAQLNPQLRRWEHIYDTVRPHQALHHLTPLELLRTFEIPQTESRVSLIMWTSTRLDDQAKRVYHRAVLKAKKEIPSKTMTLRYGTRFGLGYSYRKCKKYLYLRYVNRKFGPWALPEWWYLRYLKRRFGDRVRRRDVGPMATPELIKTEALMHADQLNRAEEPESYFGSGRRVAWTVLSMLEEQGADFTAMRSVLEFGCGSARVLRHFRHIEDLLLAGTDANPTPIEWDRKKLPGIEFSHNSLQPPLSYKDGAFDFIYGISVFTHIPLPWQRAWLDELRRVLRPGGYLLCTVHGEYFINSMLNNEDRLKLQREGNLTLDAKNPRTSYSSQVLGSWDVFQSRDEILNAFGRNFELLCYEREAVGGQGGQDVLVLRKRN